MITDKSLSIKPLSKHRKKREETFMALLFTCSLSSIFSPSNSLSTHAPRPFFCLHSNVVALQPRPVLGPQAQTHLRINHRNAAVIVRTSSSSSGVDGTDTTPPESIPPSGNKQENVSVENLPLESKLQEKADQKAKMKIAKKIRLRRKRLVRKRHLRKKGRWPPSKLKKNKNV